MKNTVNVKCIYCQKQFQFDTYPVIDLQKDQQLYNDLFSLNLFKFTCPHCQKLNIIQYNMIVVDMYKKYIVYLTQNTSSDNFKEEMDNIKNSENIKKLLSEIKHTRIVNNLNEMLQKLLIFDYDLNDKVIQLIKRGVYVNNLLDQKVYDNIKFNQIQKNTLLFTCFNSADSSIETKSFTVLTDYYNSLLEKFNIPSDDELNFININSDWAKQFEQQVEQKVVENNEQTNSNQ